MKITPIQLYRADVPEPYGMASWNVGVWEMPPGREIWGLTYDNSRTHMCYELVSSPPFKAIAERRLKNETDPDPDWLRWYFDVGRKLYATLDDLEEALQTLAYVEDETT